MSPSKRRKAIICMPPDNPDAMTELIPMAVDALAEQEAKDVAEEVELTTVFLGLEPFALVRITSAEEVGDDIDITLGIEIGGGLELSHGIELLKMAVEEMEKQVG